MTKEKAEREGLWSLNTSSPVKHRLWRSQRGWPVTYTRTRGDASGRRMRRPVAMRHALLTSLWTQPICFDRCVKYSISGKGCWMNPRHPAAVSPRVQEDPELPDTSPAKVSDSHIIGSSADRWREDRRDSALMRPRRRRRSTDLFWFT